MKLLLLSNSRNPGGGYLEHALDAFKRICATKKKAIFLPYAAVTFTWEEYLKNVQTALNPLDINVESIHQCNDPQAAIRGAELIFGGGGNTWRLLQLCRKNCLLDVIRQQVASGIPYVGWSAGTNLACPTIRTTNDMPIIDPLGLEALNLVPFQINPHYNNELPAGHQGETRSQRINEFTRINPEMPVLGIPEGTWLEITEGRCTLCGPKPAILFREGVEDIYLPAGDITQNLF